MNTNKIVITLIAVIVIVGAAGIVFVQKSRMSASYNTSPQSTTPATTTKPTKVPVTVVPAFSGYTMAKVAQHNSVSSCWSVVNGKVYDLTSWIDQHPGGSEAILMMCGRDGSAAFNDQHGGQRRPANELAGFLLGNLQ